MLQIGKREFKLFFTPTKVHKWFNPYYDVDVKVKEISASLTCPSVDEPNTELMKVITIDQSVFAYSSIVGYTKTIVGRGNCFSIELLDIKTNMKKELVCFKYNHESPDYRVHNSWIDIQDNEPHKSYKTKFQNEISQINKEILELPLPVQKDSYNKLIEKLVCGKSEPNKSLLVYIFTFKDWSHFKEFTYPEIQEKVLNKAYLKKYDSEKRCYFLSSDTRPEYACIKEDITSMLAVIEQEVITMTKKFHVERDYQKTLKELNGCTLKMP